MPVVNFSVTKPLERDVRRIIEKDGFSSKAEFFRFAAKDYINRRNGASLDDLIEHEAEEIGRLLQRKYKFKDPPSLEEQLSDIR